MPSGYLRSLNPRLPLPVWLLQIGGLMNSFGNGLALPFLVIYLHNVRGFSLGTAGLIVAVSSLAQLTAGVLAGPLIDRVGARPTLAGGLVLQAIGYGFLPLVRVPWEAFVLIAIEGAGSAGFWPSQSTLISRLTPAARRHAAFAQQRVTMNLGIGLGGLTAGWIAVVGNPTRSRCSSCSTRSRSSRTSACSSSCRIPGCRRTRSGTRRATYAAVLRHKTFLGLWTLNFMFVAAGYSLFTLLPAFARDQADLSEHQIGAVFFVNTLAIVLAQLPISRWIEGRRRMRALALMPALWAVAWLLVDAGGYWFTAGTAFAIIAFAGLILGVGECFHGPAHQALVSDIGSPHLRGRYFAVHSLSWGLAGFVGPALGGFILAAAPFALWPLASLVCLIAMVGVLRIERYIPAHLQRVPHEDALTPTLAEAPG